MIIKRTVIEKRNLRVNVVKGADDQMIEYFSDTVLGTPGGLQYKHTSIKAKIENLGDVYFLVLKKDDTILGTVGLAKRMLYIGNHEFISWYIRYFAIRAPLRSNVHKRNKNQNGQSQGKGTGLFLKLGSSFIENPFLFEDENKTTPGKSIVYSYIEKKKLSHGRF